MQQEKIIFHYSPIKAKKDTLSNLWKEEYQSYCFNVKDQSKFNHQHDVVYYADCPNVEKTTMVRVVVEFQNA